MRLHTLLLLPLLASGCGGKDDTAGDDADGDGYGVLVDCDDEDPAVNPGTFEEPYNGVDDDCDESTPDDDLDGDGWNAGYDQDCDDQDPYTYPSAAEFCDGDDNDCDMVVDEDALDTLSWYIDADRDGYGDPDQVVLACDQPTGAVANSQDCDDTDDDIHPDAEEVWDGADNDCDGEVDEDGGAPSFDWFHDADGDTYGDPFDRIEAPDQPSGYVANDNDCDDTDPEVNPAASELCNDLDDDCDMLTDEDSVCRELDVGGADDWWTGDNAGDEAGYALAGGADITGDGKDDFLIGAPSSSTGGQFYFMPGEYVGYFTGLDLHRSSSSGAITWSPPIPGSMLGTDVALLPDVDGDGDPDFAVGSPGTDGDATGSGIVVAWFSSIDDYQFISTSGTGAEMGPVADAGDADNDGLSDLLVGAPGTSSGAIGGGFAQLFLGDRSSQITTGAYWLGTGEGDRLGSSVGSAGDVDGDGYDDLLLGAYGYPIGQGTGAAWMVMGTGSWPGGAADLRDAEHLFVGAATNDHAGYALAGGHDFDWDGYDDFVITAPYNASGGSSAGAVYLYNGDASWGSGGGMYGLSSAPTTFVGEASNDRAGWSALLVQDFDGDGRDDLAVGAPYFGGSGAGRGKLYLLRGGPGVWLGACDLGAAQYSWLGEEPGDHLGFAIASGDANADGMGDLLVSATGADDAGSDAGNVYLLLSW